MHQVLIVDDELPVLEGLIHILDWSALGVETVHKASDGHEALDLLAAHSIDIVITDIRMPGMDGLELIRRIKAYWANTHCIVLSGFAEFEYAKQALASQALDYLVKPVQFKELEAAIQSAITLIEQKWGEISSRERAAAALKENLPSLREKLLFDLIRGHAYSEAELEAKMKLLELPFKLQETCSLLLVRLEDEFCTGDTRDRSLYEFAVCNIIDEILRPMADIWYCKEDHDYLVLLIRKSDAREEGQPHSAAEIPSLNAWIRSLGPKIQQCVRHYLKGRISLILGREELLSLRLPALYRELVAAMLQTIGNEHEIFLPVDGMLEPVHSLKVLYEPPSFLHMLEAGRWDDFEHKLHQAFAELGASRFDSQEHLLETYFMISQAYLHIIHKNGRKVADVIKDDPLTDALHLKPFVSVNELRRWALQTLVRIKDDVYREQKSGRARFVAKIRTYIDQHLSEGVSLQTIADSVFLHPSYVAKIFKMETGESISDYLLKLRMERAAYLLKETNEQIQVISSKLGYQNTAYFIKVFREHYKLTPQEFRHQSH